MIDRKAFAATTALVCIVAATPALAQIRLFDIPAQPLETAVGAFGKQADVQIITTRKLTRGRRSAPLRGNMTVEQALDRMLAGTGLVARATGAQTFAVVPAAASIKHSAVPPVAPAAQRRESLPVAEPQEAIASVQADGDAPTDASQEIVVTAQKREQNVQDVPVAVQVVGETQLQANAVQDFADLNRVAPSLVVRPAENAQNANVSIRGIGTLAYSPGVESSVAVIVDDVPVVSQVRAFSDLSDLERIEILRGPQSTLYGKSASAGLINIVTKGPSRQFTARAQAMATTDRQVQAGLVLSGPITHNLGFRSSVNLDDFDGNIRNVETGKWINGRRYFSFRNKLRWDPTDALRIDLGVDYMDGNSSTGRPLIALSPNARLRGNAAFTPAVFAPGITPGFDNVRVSNNFVTAADFKDFAQSLRLSCDIGGPTILSITAHDRLTQHDSLDSDESAIANFDNRQFGSYGYDQFSQEFRLVSPGGDRFRYTLGLFYSNTVFDRTFTRGPLFSSANWDASTSNDQLSGFGQLEYDVLPSTTLIAGARYSREHIDYSYHDRIAAKTYAGSTVDHFGTYKLGIQQKLTPDVMAFLTYATGHKGQAYDLSSGFNQVRADGGPVRPEKSKDWELGIRSQFLDRKATLNVTLFKADYQDFQAQGIETLADGTQNFRLTNVGAIRTRGVEVETALRPADNLSIGASATYLDAIITSFPRAACYVLQTAAQGCTGTPASQNLAGTRPQQAPEWKIAASYDWSHSLGDADFRFFSQGALSYQGKVQYQLSNDPLTVQDAYTIVNLSMGLRQTDRKWQAALFVNNLFDKQYHSLLNNASGSYGNQLAIQGYVPRDFRRYGGVRLSYQF